MTFLALILELLVALAKALGLVAASGSAPPPANEDFTRESNRISKASRAGRADLPVGLPDPNDRDAAG